MAGVDDRRFDVKDILTKVTTGWVTPPNEPQLVVEGSPAVAGEKIPYRSNYIGKAATTVTDGVILIKKDYDFDRVKLSHITYENRLWSFPCSIISESNVLLQGIFDQMREVFDRYTSAPWSTSTLGTSTTYRSASIDAAKAMPGTQYVMDTTVYLLEQFVRVVIA